MEVDTFFARKRKEAMKTGSDASAKMEGGRHKAALAITLINAEVS
jgi:hypothetical protein